MFKKISNLLMQFALMTGLIYASLYLASGHLAAIAAYLPLPDADKYGNIAVAPEADSGQEMVIKVIERAIGYAKVLVGIAAIFIIVAMGAKIATSSGNEENVSKATKGLMYSIAAFAVISLSGEMGQLLGFFKEDAPFGGQSNGGIIGSPGQILERVHLFDKQVEIVIVFIKYLIGSVAVAMVVINGVKLVAGGGEEENLKKAKNGIVYAMAGLLTMYFANIVVNNVFYKLDEKDIYSGLEGVTPEIDVESGLSELVGVTNFIVSFLGPILFLLLFVGGAMYLTSGGDEEKMNKAKRLIISAMIGVIVIYGAFAIISTVISGSFQEVTEIL